MVLKYTLGITYCKTANEIRSRINGKTPIMLGRSWESGERKREVIAEWLEEIYKFVNSNQEKPTPRALCNTGIDGECYAVAYQFERVYLGVDEVGTFSIPNDSILSVENVYYRDNDGKWQDVTDVFEETIDNCNDLEDRLSLPVQCRAMYEQRTDKEMGAPLVAEVEIMWKDEPYHTETTTIGLRPYASMPDGIEDEEIVYYVSDIEELAELSFITLEEYKKGKFPSRCKQDFCVVGLYGMGRYARDYEREDC